MSDYVKQMESLLQLMLDPENQPPQYTTDRAWSVFQNMKFQEWARQQMEAAKRPICADCGKRVEGEFLFCTLRGGENGFEPRYTHKPGGCPQ